MTLHDVVSQEQLNVYYVQEHLVDRDAKIDRLISETGVLSVRGSKVDDRDMILALLEESVALGHWRSLR